MFRNAIDPFLYKRRLHFLWFIFMFLWQRNRHKPSNFLLQVWNPKVSTGCLASLSTLRMWGLLLIEVCWQWIPLLYALGFSSEVRTFELQRSVIQCCILFWKWQRKPTAMILYFEQIQNGILVIYFLFCVNRWREGWHQCQCLCRH